MHPAEAQAPRRHNSHVPDGDLRDAALVLSGGGINGVLLELGFLKRLRETPVWDRIGWIYGTSAGAVAGTMAALDRLEELESFLLELQADDVFRPRRVWQLPLGGLHDYTLPDTIAKHLGGPEELGSSLAAADIELVVFATDVSEHLEPDTARDFELVYPAHSTPPETMGRAILASAAVSALVLPVRVDDTIATDGGWVRNFPLEHAELNPAVRSVIAFRYLASYRPTDIAFLGRVRERLERFRAVSPVRALLEEVRLAEERSQRGEPAHYPELIVRLMRVAIARNTVLEERISSDRDASVRALHRLRDEVIDTAVGRCAAVATTSPPRGSRRALRRSGLPVPPRQARWTGSSFAPRPATTALDPTYRGPWADGEQARSHRARLPPHGRRARPERVMAGSPMKRSAGVRAGGRTPCR